MIVTIVKGDIKTTVDEQLFEQKYKPKGWTIDHYDLGGTETIEIEDYKVSSTEEQVVKNIEATKKKRTTSKKFDDKIIKEKADV